MSSRDDQLREALAGCEAACHALAGACAAVDGDTAELVDSWHLATATARLLGRFADYDPTHTAMQVSVCRLVASRAAAVGVVATRCATACSAVLELIWDRALDPKASWDDGNGPVDLVPEDAPSFEDDSSVTSDHPGASQPASRRATRAGIAPTRVPVGAR